jgi:hypothetical protein
LNIMAETMALRRELAALAAKPEWALLTRYDLLRKKPPSSLKEQIWRHTRRLLTASGLASPHVTKYPWLPTLKHAPVTTDAKTLLIWAPGAERDGLRLACDGFLRRLKSNTDLAPVLVTDIAEFAYFSRLGWLVEYLPELNGERPQSYRERKRAYLLWRYRDAWIVPLSAGLADDTEWNALLEMSGK